MKIPKNQLIYVSFLSWQRDVYKFTRDHEQAEVFYGNYTYYKTTDDMKYSSKIAENVVSVERH